MWDYVKKNWPIAIAVLAAAPSALATYLNLIAMPLLMRLLIICASAFIVVTFVVIALTSIPARGIGGFGSEPAKRHKFGLASACEVVLILAICAGAVYLLTYTVTYHNITLNQTTVRREPTAGMIELRPSYVPADVTLILSTPQPDVRILDVRPQGCGDDPINAVNIQDLNDFSATIRVDEFKQSQKLCVPYRLSGRADHLSIRAKATMKETKVSYMEILNNDRIGMYNQRVYVFGGVLCLFALGLFFLRFYWPRHN